MKLFGFELIRADQNAKASFVEPLNDDGALTLGGAVGGSYGFALDTDSSAKSEAELITRYRGMMQSAEIQQAVDEVINELVSVDEDEKVVKIVLDDLQVPTKIKRIIEEEFENILRLLDFSNNAYEILSKFFVDGRLNYHIAVDKENLLAGIQALHYIDPRKIRLVRELNDTSRARNTDDDEKLKKFVVNEYYAYSDTNFGTMGGLYGSSIASDLTGMMIAKDSIARVTSGIVNESNTAVLSWLHTAYKPLNQLRSLEDATVIYTLVRAPERRIFYVDVGSLPKAKAEQYLYDMMARHKNKVTYDASSGNLKDSRSMMTMTEDYWFPRREGNRSTEIDVLPSAGQLMGNETIEYFQNKLYKSLNVPIGRLQPENMAAFGRTSEMTREEAKFSKFIKRVRARFTILFDILMERQLVLKGICSPEEWAEMKDEVRYDFNKDNYYTELLELEILRERVAAAKDFSELNDDYFSKEWVRKKILRQTEEEIEELAAQREYDREEDMERQMQAQQGMVPPPEGGPTDPNAPVQQESKPTIASTKGRFGLLTQ